jgi:hypothetical protein
MSGRRKPFLKKSRDNCRRKSRKNRARRLLFEPLEAKLMLNSVPFALDDPLYSTALNTDLVVSTAATGVVNNDFDPEFASLSASVVTNPANGALLSFNSDGTFTYRPNNGFSGIDTFQYKLNDGTHDSHPATATVAVGGNFGPRTNLDERLESEMLHTSRSRWD